VSKRARWPADQIQQDQTGPESTSYLVQGIAAVYGRSDTVSGVAEYRFDYVSRIVVILHDQDRFRRLIGHVVFVLP